MSAATSTAKPSFLKKVRNLNFFKRFPLTTVWLLLVLLGALLGDACFLLNHQYELGLRVCEPTFLATFKFNFSFLSVLGLTFSLVADLFFENSKSQQKNLLRLGVFVGSIALYLALFGWAESWWDSELKFFNFFLVNVVGVAAFLIAPFWNKPKTEATDKSMWEAHYKIIFQEFKGWLLTGGVWIVLAIFGGLSLLLFSGNYSYFDDMGILSSFGLFGFLTKTLSTLLFLFLVLPYVVGRYPFAEELREEKLQDHRAYKFLRFVTKYLAVPLVFAVGVLALSFAVFQFTEILESPNLLPAVYTFGFAGVLTYLLSYFYQETNDWFLPPFRKFFTVALVILSVLAIANGAEKGGDFFESEVGLINLFMGIFIPVWFMVVGLYFTVQKEKRLGFLHLSGIAICLLFLALSRVASLFM